MTRILSGDLLVADVIVPVGDNRALAALIRQYELTPGVKARLDETGLQQFLQAVEGCSVTVTPGGSSANMLTTLCKLLPGQLQVQFIGVAGDDYFSSFITSAFHDAGIGLVPLRTHAVQQSAVSFVLVFPDGQCTIATYPGNAHSILTADIITDDMVEKSDVILAQGSLWHKLERGFGDRLVHLSRRYDKELWLTLPTQTYLSEEASAHFKTFLPQADLVLGNEAELLRVFGGTVEEGLRALQKCVSHPAHNAARHPTGFITFGKKGAVLVTATMIESVRPENIRAHEIVNTLGAGDTSYAGFAAAYLKGVHDKDAAKIAMVLAGEKLKVNNPRLANPLATLRRSTPKLAELLVV